VGGRRGSRLRLGADFGVPSTPKEPERSAGRGGREEGRRRKESSGGKKRQQASPRCGFRGTLHAQGAPSERRREEEQEEGRKKEEGIVGGRRGSRLRLGADFGVPSTPEEPERAHGERRKRRKEEGGRKFGGEEEAGGFA
jgi:hypothetical protein